MIKRIKLFNFLCHEENEYFFNDGVYCIVGPNGSGKSAIVEGILYALYGFGRTNPARLIRNRCTEGFVEVELSDGTVIRRGRNRGAGYISINGTIKPNQKEAQDEIESKIRISLDRLLASSYMLQNTYSSFTSSTPATRKEILRNVIGIEIYEELENAAKEKLRTLGDEISALETEKNLITPQEDVEELQRILAAELPQRPKWTMEQIAMQEQYSRLAPIIDAKRRIIEKANALTEETRKEYEELLERRKEYLIESEIRLEKTREVNRRIQKLEQELAERKNRKKTLEREIESLAQSICPTCKQPINDPRLIEARRKEYEEIDISAIERQIAEARTELPPELPSFPTERLKYLETLPFGIDINKIIEEIEEYERMNYGITDVNLARKEYERYATECKEQEKRKALAAEKIKEIERYRERAAEIERILEQKRTLYQKYFDLAKALGKDGIQAAIFDTVIPEIQIFANAILARIGADYTVKIFTIKEGKETLEIELETKNAPIRVESLSGGERFRLDIAIRLALAKLCRSKILVIDEGIAPLDENGLDGIVQLIEEVKEDFELILMITHITRISESFTNVIRLGE